jgi:hypothetical protein
MLGATGRTLSMHRGGRIRERILESIYTSTRRDALYYLRALDESFPRFSPSAQLHGGLMRLPAKSAQPYPTSPHIDFIALNSKI